METEANENPRYSPMAVPARSSFVFRPMKRAVADQKEECADNDAGANLRPGGRKMFCQAPDEENRAGRQVAEAGGVEWGNRLHGITNRQVCGAPDEADGKKGKDDEGAIQSRGPRGYDAWDFLNDYGGFHGHRFTNRR